MSDIELAREIAAHQCESRQADGWAKMYRSGEWDNQPYVEVALAAFAAIRALALQPREGGGKETLHPVCGAVRVPISPTDDMVEAATWAFKGEVSFEEVRDAWDRMIRSALPTMPNFDPDLTDCDVPRGKGE